MSTVKHDWTSFQIKTYIENATIQDIFRMCSTSEGLTEWFIRKSEFKDVNDNKKDENEVIKVGDTYTWIFNTGNTVKGKIINIKRNEFVSFTFGENNPDSNDYVFVTFRIEEVEGRILFQISQENMVDNNWGRFYAYISCNMGWSFFLYNLKSIFENNYDLRIASTTRLDVDAPSRYGLENYTWTSFTFKEYIKKPREEVFSKWTSANELSTWWVKEADYLTPSKELRNKNQRINKGDQYKYKFHSGNEMSGRILELVDNELIKFTFGKKEPTSDEDVTVTVTFHYDEDEYTRIEVLQENIADNEYGYVNYNMKCILGWSHYLTNLRSVMEANFDLRDKDDSINV